MLNFRDCTADEWLALAIEADETKKACGFGDPAYERFARMASEYFAAARMAEHAAGTAGQSLNTEGQ
jgi:hypothetical protein